MASAGAEDTTGGGGGGNSSLRRWLACILPCGALDLIRVVHSDGHVEEYSRPVSAGEVLRSHPDHFLSRPCSSLSQGSAAGGGSQNAVRRRVLVVSPDSDLKRGHIYFLVPKSSLPAEEATRSEKKSSGTSGGAAKKRQEVGAAASVGGVMARRPSRHRRCQSGPALGLWRPHLEQITEDPSRSPTQASSVSSAMSGRREVSWG